MRYRYVLIGGGEQVGTFKERFGAVGDTIVSDNGTEVMIPWTSVKCRITVPEKETS